MKAAARLSPAVLAALFVGALALGAVHVALVGAEQQTPGLARKYDAVARHVLAGDGFWLQVGEAPVPFCDRLPGYVLLLAGLVAVTGGSPAALVGAHLVLGALQAPLLAAAGARLAGRRAGLAAGVLAALWPPLWHADVQLVETGALAAVMAWLLLALVLAREEPRWPRLVSVALAATAAFALRPDAMLVPLLAAALLLWQARSLRGALLAALLPLVVAVPWAARNARVADGPFVAVGLGANLLGALGESVADDAPLLDDRGVAASEGHESLFWPDPLRRDRARVRRGLALIRQHPAGYAKGCARRLVVSASQYQGRLWPWGTTPEEQLASWRASHPGAPRYDGLFRATLSWMATQPLVALLTLAWGPALVAASAWAAWRLRRRPRDLALLLALPAYGLLVHVPLHAEPRYVLPFVGCLLVLVAVAFAGASRSAGGLGHDGAPPSPRESP